MKKKLKKRPSKQGWLESPLFLTLLRLIPTIILLSGLAVGVGNLMFKYNERVLGEETNLPQTKSTTVEQRLSELKALRQTINSKLLEKEIEKLLGF